MQSTDSDSPLVRILCERIIEAYDWCRQHQLDKEFVIISAMVSKLTDFREPDSIKLDLVAALSDRGDPDQNELLDIRLRERGYTLDTLRALVMGLDGERIWAIDKLIDRQLKTARQLEKSHYEIVARSLIIRRMQLQLQEMERDLKAIEHDNPEAA